jgi:MFS family permease
MKLDEAQLGQLLFGFAFGAIAMVILSGQLIDRFSKGRIGLVGGTVFGLSVFTMPWSVSVGQLAIVVVIAGAGFGTLDVTMNTSASIIERQMGRAKMSSFHAMFSVGNLIGAFMVGKIIAHGGTLHLCLGTAGVLVILLPIGSGMLASAESEPLPHRAGDDAERTQSAHAGRALIALYGGLALMFVLAEAGVMDWSGVFVVKGLSASESLGAYAFGVLTGAVAIGRLLGDRLVQRVGRSTTIQIGAAICAACVLAMVTFGSVPIAFVALAICGLGMANINPAILAATGRLGFAQTGKAMSMVKAMGYLGLLAGPALLGLLAKQAGLQASLLVVSFAFAAIAGLSLLSGRRRPTARK